MILVKMIFENNVRHGVIQRPAAAAAAAAIHPRTLFYDVYSPHVRRSGIEHRQTSFTYKTDRYEVPRLSNNRCETKEATAAPDIVTRKWAALKRQRKTRFN
jgi:hypothetical protein